MSDPLVLVVEDEPQVMRFLRATLPDHGYRMVEAGTGAQALVEASTRGPDLVLLDLQAPHLSPVHDVPALLVFAAGRGDVTDVLVDGDPVVRDRRSTRLDTAALLAAADERGADAWAAVERP